MFYVTLILSIYLGREQVQLHRGKLEQPIKNLLVFYENIIFAIFKHFGHLKGILFYYRLLLLLLLLPP